MPNAIKYNVNAETLALKKGNFWIGTGAVGKGPTSTTGYYNGISPPSGGYTIYLNKESGGPSIYTASNDAQLISLTNSIAGQSYTSSTQCFNYYYGQTDKVLVNQDYPPSFPYIVMDGLVLYLDAGITQSYPGSGTTWSDINGLGPKNNGTLINGPTFNSANGGSIVFDGSDDYVESGIIEPQTLTLCAWFKPTGPPSNNDTAGGTIIVNSPQLENNAVQYAITYSWLLQRVIFGIQSNNEFLATSDNSVLQNQIHYMVGTFDGTNRKIYINGVNVASDVREVSPIYPTSGNRNVQVGRWGYPGYSRTINGNLYNAGIYNRALTASEVLQNYQAVFPRILGENIVTNGLTMYQDAGYSLSYPTTGTSWYNVSGVSGKTGTLTNGPTYNSANGGSIVFDGVDDYVIIPTSFGNEGSICCWVYPKSTNDNFFTYTNSTNLPTNEYSHKLGITTDNKLNAYIWPGSPTNFNGTDFMATNRWHYCVFWWKVGVGYGSYLNGVSQGSGSLIYGPNAGSHLFVGSNSGGPASGYLNGNVSILQTYSMVLSQTEILQNYNAQKGRFGL